MSEQPKAILFGAIGTLAETSELQRSAFNAAFRDAGLDWEWGREEYTKMLRQPGGKARIDRYAEARGEEVDVDRLYRAKVAAFRGFVERDGLRLRAGVAEVIADAKAAGAKLGFATTTGPDTVDLILAGLSGEVTREDFDFIGDRMMVEKGKPAPDIYLSALKHLGLSAGEVIAIEDTPESVEAALAANLRCIGFPGNAAEGRIFPDGVEHVIDRLEPVFCDLGQMAE